MQRRAIRLRSDVNGNPRAVQGDVLWSGRIVSGDFLFVNRWLWNFRHPRRGEVMVFSTNGINGLQQGTHYIKRMCGVPNERLTIKAPQIYSNDEPIVSPAILGKIARKEKLAGAYNNGFRGYEMSHRACTPGARAAIRRFMNEGERLSRDIAERYTSS